MTLQKNFLPLPLLVSTRVELVHVYASKYWWSCFRKFPLENLVQLCKVDPISLEEGFAFRILNIKSQLPPFQVNKQTRKHPKNMKRVNCEIRPNSPNGPIGESKMPTSTCPTKVGPILSHGPRSGRRPRLAHHVSRNLFYKQGRLVQQAWEACSAGLNGLLSKFVRLALQGKEAGPHYYKKAPTPSKKVCVTNPSLAL